MLQMGKDHGKGQAGGSECYIWVSVFRRSWERTSIARVGVCMECSLGREAAAGTCATSGVTGVGRDKSQRKA